MKRIPGCTGVLIPGMEARILRDDGSDADVNEVGELYLKGGNIAMGYWNNEKATREAFVDGWLRTGDKFRVDEEGYFLYVSFVSVATCNTKHDLDSFADRAKVGSDFFVGNILLTHRHWLCQDTLKVSGTQVSPVEIENVLLSHPGGIITDATVAGVSGGRTSDEKVPRAWVVLSESGKKIGAAAAIKELETWYQENLSKYKWLRGGIEVVRQVCWVSHSWVSLVLMCNHRSPSRRLVRF